ncbi:MAG: NADH-quinone oxidoreductase subunit L [Raineya sp.]|jgi:NADH-quinone oxidoreductase subunit L|nr:NADH-quinone oxidoreductase subunit L [Raineya sp.]
MAFLLIVLLTPFFTFLTLFLNQKKTQKWATWISHISFLVSLLAAGYIFLYLPKPFYEVFEWVSFSKIRLGFEIRNLESLMLLLVLFVALMVSIFSSVYMAHEKNISRYFAYLQLFTFAMLALVVSSNLLQTYVFWEIVGFTSYLLIGFWQERPEAVWASRKAFLVNRVGDIGFLIGLVLIFANFKTVSFSELYTLKFTTEQHSLHVWIGICLFLGAMAKSAQFPLHIWLPNAMEGPTPISALIHAATMVAAGVFLMAKMSFFLTPETKNFIAIIGAISMFLGAYWAVFQRDIKKVLAYSTISQLGLMILGIGVGGYEASLLHLFTHAFFKAGLFLCAGVVIHQLHKIEKQYHWHFDVQDMHYMGGFKQKMPFLFIVYTLCMLALAGLPFFSGFLSKDAIFIHIFQHNAIHNSILSWTLLILPLLASFLTAFYMARQWMLVFFGEFRLEKDKNQTVEFESIPLNFKIPLILLSLGALGVFFSVNPFVAEKSWLWELLQSNTSESNQISHIEVALITSILAILGLLLGFWQKTSVAIAQILKISWGIPTIFFRLSRMIAQGIYKNYQAQKLEGVSILIEPIMFLAKVSTSIEKRIDGFVNFIPKLKVVLAHIITWIDRTIIDGLIHVVLWFGKSLGEIFRQSQGKYVQAYFGFVMIVLFVILFLTIHYFN